MGLVISSINSNKIILKTAESNTHTLEGYSKIARFFRAIMEYISRITCCCCPMQPLLKVSLKDKAVYLHPDQIKACFTALQLTGPANTSLCQETLHHYIINVTIPRPKPIDSGSGKQPIRVHIQKTDGSYRISHETVQKYLAEHPEFQFSENASESDAIFYLFGHKPSRTSECFAGITLDRPKGQPVVGVFVTELSASKAPNEESSNDIANATSITLVGDWDTREIFRNDWNKQQLEKCRLFFKK